jgi:hypothetical protein
VGPRNACRAAEHPQQVRGEDSRRSRPSTS